MVVREFIIFLKCGKYKFIIYNKKFINNELKQHMNNEFWTQYVMFGNWFST